VPVPDNWYRPHRHPYYPIGNGGCYFHCEYYSHGAAGMIGVAAGSVPFSLLGISGHLVPVRFLLFPSIVGYPFCLICFNFNYIKKRETKRGKKRIIKNCRLTFLTLSPLCVKYPFLAIYEDEKSETIYLFFIY
jgi:hypothetical protein